MIGTNQFRSGMEIPKIGTVDNGNTFDMSDDQRPSLLKSPGPTSYVQSLIDKQKKGFPLSPDEQDVVSQYENGFIDINGRRTGKSIPVGSPSI